MKPWGRLQRGRDSFSTLEHIFLTISVARQEGSHVSSRVVSLFHQRKHMAAAGVSLAMSRVTLFFGMLRDPKPRILTGRFTGERQCGAPFCVPQRC
eukprot:gene24250-biopygen9923